MATLLRKICERAFRHDDWNIGIVDTPIVSLLNREKELPIHWFPRSAKGAFLADPFGVMRDGTINILCEEFDYRSPKGRIVSIEFTNGIFTKPKVVLELPFHVSYPYLIQHDGATYCLPETNEAFEIGLYKARDFPNQWDKVTTLVDDFAGVDSTVFRYDGRWWLTCTDEEGSLEDLYAWYSSDLLGPWQPHAANPIKRDIRSARPAGTPFLHRGNLYRPAQDCSKTYGGRIVLNRILKLTPSEFKEEPASFIEPDEDGPWPDGAHTVSEVGSVTLLDGKRQRFIPSALKNDPLYKRACQITRRGAKQ